MRFRPCFLVLVACAGLLPGCSDEGPTDERSPNAAPTADFAVACIGLTCTLTNQSSDADGIIGACAWDFGDGGTSTECDPTHAYAAPGGAFTITLTVSDDRGVEGAASRQVNLSPENAAPQADLAVSCTNLTCSFTDRSSDGDGTIEAWAWDFGDGQTNSERNPTHDYAHPGGQFAVTLTVSDDDGAEASAVKPLVVTADPGPVPPPPGQIAFVRDGQIHLVNPDGSGLIRLSAGPNDADPAWSPDGRRIAFTRYLGWPRADIYVMDADGSDLVARTSSGWNEMPTWSPDGIRIAFATLRGGSLDVYVMGAEEDGAGADAMLTLRGWDGYPAWSPDGSRVAFVSDWRAYDIHYDVYVVDAAMGVTTLDEEPLVPTSFFSPTTEQYQPAWSPDGSRLAFVSCPWAYYPCSSSTVTVVNADGSGVVEVAVTSGFARPTWSPDGRWIAFGSADGLERVGVDGGGRGLIIAEGRSPAWRP